MIIVNAYIRNNKSKKSLWNDVHDKFPVNTWRGNKEQVLKCISDLLENKNSGVVKIEVVLDEEHELASIGQNPRDLGGE
jgi:hypothetical protein